MLYVVGFGAGNRDGMTLEAEKAINSSDLIVGYTTYIDIIKKYFPDFSHKDFLATGMKREKERVIMALDNAANGKNVSLVCSGDSAVYGMAGLVYELSGNYPDIEIEIISGVTAAISGGAVLGAPLTNDFTVISLSDLLTPWDKIACRLEYAAKGDFVIALYNPSSKSREEKFFRACDILLENKDKKTVCGYVKNIGRKGQESRIFPLSEIKNMPVDMFTTVFIGSSETKVINGKMVTPRGYKNV